MISESLPHKAVATGWLLLVALLVSLAIKQGPAFDSSIFALLPESEQNPVITNATEQMAGGFSRRLILVVSGEQGGAVRKAVKTAASALLELDEVASVVWQVSDNELEKLSDELNPYRFTVLDENLRQRLLEGNFEEIKARALFRLYSPLALSNNTLIEDPFGLYAELNLNRQSNLNLKISDGLLQVPDTAQPTYMLIVNLAGDPFSFKVQNSVLGVVGNLSQTMRQAGVEIRRSGMLLHAAAGARQASSEISTIGFGSLLGIVIAVLLVFRRLKSLLLMLLPVVVGCTAAAAVTLLIFGRVHLITFAFGAGLVGVAIDYALHYLCERRVTDSGFVLKKILPGLGLGLFSSVVAYAAMALTPFPGLRQMAVFSVVGLVAAWLTVVLWLPMLTRQDVISELSFAIYLAKLRAGLPRIEQQPLLIVLLFVVSFVAFFGLWSSKSLDDVRLLQTSPASLINEEGQVQKLLGAASSSRFIAISAASIEQCLQLEERLAVDLNALKDSGELQGYRAVSQVLPSLQRQQYNVELVGRLYQSSLADFYRGLKLTQQHEQDSQAYLTQGQTALLLPEAWRQLKSSENWKDLILHQTDGSVVTIVSLTGEVDDVLQASLRSIVTSYEGMYYVDRVGGITELLTSYREQIVDWVAVAYLLVFLVLIRRYRVQAWRILLPPLLASLFTLALLAQIEQGINLFHLMALILVLGIGLDMGIFLSESRDHSHTWLAVSLSAYTSLLAFGLLAMSNTPVLHHFGLTVLLGLTFVWLLVPLMRNTTPGEND